MTILSILFWSLVIVTAGVSFRWGSMIGLTFFLFALVTAAMVASHFGLR